MNRNTAQITHSLSNYPHPTKPSCRTMKRETRAQKAIRRINREKAAYARREQEVQS